MAGTDPAAAGDHGRRSVNLVGRHGVTVIVMALGAAIAIVGSWLPWVYSGTRERNSYDIFALIDRIGFSPDGPVGVLVRWWPLVPLLTIGAMVLAWWGWRRSGGALGIVGGLYAGGVGAAVARAPGAIEIGAGPNMTFVGGVVLLVGSAATCVVSAPGRTPPTERAP